MHRKVLDASNSGHLALNKLTLLGLKFLFSLKVLLFPFLLDLIHSFGKNKALISVGIKLVCKSFFLGPFLEKFLDSLFDLFVFGLEFIELRLNVFCIFFL